jgi:hypothetical protein
MGVRERAGAVVLATPAAPQTQNSRINAHPSAYTPEVAAALDRVSAAVWRAFLRVLAHEAGEAAERPAPLPGAEHRTPPGGTPAKKCKGGTPSNVPPKG